MTEHFPRNVWCPDFAYLRGMTNITSYRDLDAWQLGMSFVEDVYALTRDFPREELFGLTSQLRRAAVSIPSQVAEGHRQGTRAYRHYVVRALGSQAECETQLELARRLKLGSPERIEPVSALAGRVGQNLARPSSKPTENGGPSNTEGSENREPPNPNPESLNSRIPNPESRLPCSFPVPQADTPSNRGPWGKRGEQGARRESTGAELGSQVHCRTI